MKYNASKVGGESIGEIHLDQAPNLGDIIRLHDGLGYRVVSVGDFSGDDDSALGLAPQPVGRVIIAG